MSDLICAGETLADIVGGVEYVGGAPANVACAAARLGSSALILSRIGEDARGSRILTETARAGVSGAGFQIDAFAPTRGVIVARDAQGERTFAGFDGTPPFADQGLDADSIPAEAFAQARWFVCGSPALAALASRAAISRCLEFCEILADVAFVADVNRRDLFWDDPLSTKSLIEMMLLANAVVVKATEEEALWLFGMTDAAKIRRALPDAELVLVTRGSAGGEYATRDAAGLWRAFEVECVDSTGAGDAFLGVLLHQLKRSDLSDTRKLEDALAIASAAGALTTQKAGALQGQPDACQLGAFLAQHAPHVVNRHPG